MWAITKLLSFLPNIFRGATGWLILALVVGGGLWWLVHSYNESIRDAVYEEFFQERMEEQLAEQEREIERLTQLQDQIEQSLSELSQRREEINQNVQDAIRDTEQYEDGEVAPVLEKTLDRIRSLIGGEPEQENPPVPEKKPDNSAIQEWRDSQ